MMATLKSNRRRRWPVAFSVFLLGIGALASAQDLNPASGLVGPLSSLALPMQGTTRHEGSWDRKGGNGDARGVAPGETITLLDYKGAGMIRRFWVTIAPRAEMTIHSQAILRMYWDGEKNPSVEAPIGAFFGVGFGEQVDYISLPLNETSGGYNCYWPMPFHKSARWTLTNLSHRRIDAFYYNIDFTGYKKLPKGLMHFHAQFRRENPTTPHKNYTILEATGSGHYVGTALFMQNRRGHDLGFLEGDEMVYVDGEKTPSVNGTGTEDYFSSGWYFDRGLYSAPYHGVVIKDTKLGRVSAYRWHIEDAMPFHKSIRFTIEHGHDNDHEADYSSVAYWYQNEPHAPFAPLPKNPDDLLPFVPPPPMKIQGAIEGESMAGTATATAGEIQTQDMSVFGGQWSDDGQLWWLPSEAGAVLTLPLRAPAAGTYEVVAYFTQAPDYGEVRAMQDGSPIGPEANLYAPKVRPSGAVSLGKASFKEGLNSLDLKLTGKDDRSQGYLVGIDAIVLKPAG
jgi:hypothetical protein